MPYQPTTNFNDSNNVDLGKKLVTKDYLLGVYGTILESTGNSGLTVSPSLWTWGANGSGQLGVNDAATRSTPVTTISGGTNWKSVAGGLDHTAAIKTDGTLWAWGANYGGQIGNNSNGSNIYAPVTTFAGGTNWKQVACGEQYTAAIKTDGTLWNWGYNFYGHLGINSETDRSTPVTTRLGGTNWKQVAVGQYHTAAIKTDGTLWTWGGDITGQLGINESTVFANRSTPVTTLVGGTNWKQVACGRDHTVAIKIDGTLWVWGKNSYGQLAIPDGIDRLTPTTTFVGGTNWKQVASGGIYTAAIKTDGTLWTWGSSATPVTTILGGTNWKQVACGGNHTAAIKTDGTLWIWGSNFYGTLGINDTANRTTPVTTILGGTNWKSVAGGSSHTSAIQSVDYI